MMIVPTSGLLLAALVFTGTDSSPGKIGHWAPPQKWPVIAIHAALLPTGKVLHYSYGSPGSSAVLWDPSSGVFTPVNFTQNIFCSGLSLLPDGSLFLTGGTLPGCNFTGSPETNAFDSFGQFWTPTGTMVDGRWYPTNIALGDGSTLIVSGLDLVCETNPIMERYTPGSGLTVVPSGELVTALYPRLHLLTTGDVVRVGPESATLRFNPDSGDPWQFVASMLSWRCQGTSVLLPGRTDQVLTMGGDCPDTGTAEIIDFTVPKPQWTSTGSMNHPRAHADALILPDATVMVAGGGTEELYGMPVLIPERFDPDTGTWTELAAHAYGRMYHATTVLLPDGRVLLAGQDSGLSSFSGEIYSPPYLFQGPRPELLAAPQRMSYGRPLSLATTDTAEIGAVALMAPSTVTHSVNSTQRYVGLDFEVLHGSALRVTAPLNGNHAPPGYYMLFVVNQAGVPAVSEFIQVGFWPEGDIDGDGLVTILDFLLVLGNWGPCAGCNADLDGDGEVGIFEFLTVLGNWS